MIISPIKPQQFDQIVAHLKAGEVVAIPTETVYGLAADASQPAAVAKIYELKKRPLNNPLIVHVANLAQLKNWIGDFPETAAILAEAFWPGPMTLVLPKAAWVPDIVTAGQNTIAIRIPAHPIALAILEKFQGGLAAPSANPFTQVSPTTAAHVAEVFDESLWIVEGGSTDIGLESTIIDCTQKELTVLRHGVITAADIFAKTGLRVVIKNYASQVLHPGQALKHYSPNTPLKLFDTQTLVKKVSQTEKDLSRIGILHYSKLSLGNCRCEVKLANDAKRYAKYLYAALHDLDKADCQEIWVELPPVDEAWQAIHERLAKAAR